MPREHRLLFRLWRRWHEPPRATIALLIVLSIFYALSVLLSLRWGPTVVTIWGAKWNTAIERGDYWRLLSCTFLHGNLVHFALNGIAVLIFGILAERLFGWERFLLIYLLTGLGGSVASWRFTEVPSIGASGALFGLLGALLVFGLRHRRRLNPEMRELLGRNLKTLILLNLGIGILLYRYVDNFAHLGGLVTGALIALLVDEEWTDREPWRTLLRTLLATLLLAVLYTWWKMFQLFFVLWFRGV